VTTTHPELCNNSESKLALNIQAKLCADGGITVPHRSKHKQKCRSTREILTC